MTIRTLVGWYGRMHSFGVMLWVAFALYGMDLVPGMLWIGSSGYCHRARIYGYVGVLRTLV